MSTVSQRFDKFLSNIQLTESQLEDAKTKYDGVCKKLHDHYYNTTYNGSTKLLTGSYGKRNAIAPPTDVDIIFKLPNSEKKRYDNYTYNGQSQLLQDIKNKLLEKYSFTSIRGDGPVVSINFISYKIELIPAFNIGDGYYVPITRDGGSWERTEPQTEKKHVSDSNKRSNGNTIKLIKMIKAWKHECNVPIKSIVIELIVVQFLETWKYYDQSAVYYDWMIRDFFQKLVSLSNQSCYIPGTLNRLDYGDAWKSKAKTAYDRAKKACDYESKDLTYVATDEWKKIFGSRFNY